MRGSGKFFTGSPLKAVNIQIKTTNTPICCSESLNAYKAIEERERERERACT